MILENISHILVDVILNNLKINFIEQFKSGIRPSLQLGRVTKKVKILT